MKDDTTKRQNTRAKLRLVAKEKERPEWRTGWQLGLLVDKDGKPTGSPANVAHTLRHSPDWQDVLWFDAFAVVVITKKRPPFLEPDEPWTVNQPWNCYSACNFDPLSRGIGVQN